jgi:DNA polymerase III subunit gamma/tau
VELWPAVVERVKEHNALLAHALADARPVDASERELVLAFPIGSEFNKRKAEQDEHRRIVADAVKALSGHRLMPRYELREMEAAAPARLSEEQVVQQFIDEFDAQETGD